MYLEFIFSFLHVLLVIPTALSFVVLEFSKIYQFFIAVFINVSYSIYNFTVKKAIYSIAPNGNIIYVMLNMKF